MNKRILPIGLLAIFIFLVHYFTPGWLIYHDGPYTGKVVDIDTNEPLQGAVVLVIWNLAFYGSPGGSISNFLNAKETISDENGFFEIPAILDFHWWPAASLEAPNFVVFKPGYDSYPTSLPIVTPTFTEKDWDLKHNYQLKHAINKNSNSDILIKLSKAKNIKEREWIVKHIYLNLIPEVELTKKAKNLIKEINSERLAINKK